MKALEPLAVGAGSLESRYLKLRLFGAGIFLGFLTGTSLSVADPPGSRAASFEMRARIAGAAHAVSGNARSAISWASAQLPPQYKARIAQGARACVWPL